MAEIRRTYEENRDYETITRSYTLISSIDQLELNFLGQTIGRGFEYEDRVIHRSVVSVSGRTKTSGFLALSTEDLVETTQFFDEKSWKRLNQEFRESFNEGSVCFRRQLGRGSDSRLWAHESAGQLLFGEEGLALIWTLDQLRVRASITQDQMPECLAFMGVKGVHQLLLSMSDDEDQGWRDLCRYFESQGTIVPPASQEQD